MVVESQRNPHHPFLMLSWSALCQLAAPHESDARSTHVRPPATNDEQRAVMSNLRLEACCREMLFNGYGERLSGNSSIRCWMSTCDRCPAHYLRRLL